MKIRVPLAVLIATAIAVPASAQPAGRCTREVLPVRGVPVSATICVSSLGPRFNHELPVGVDETFASPRASFTQQSMLRFIAGEPASRVLEDVPLDRLGLEGTLHLGLVFRGGAVRVDSAMLSPGAITVK